MTEDRTKVFQAENSGESWKVFEIADDSEEAATYFMVPHSENKAKNYCFACNFQQRLIPAIEWKDSHGATN